VNTVNAPDQIPELEEAGTLDILIEGAPEDGTFVRLGDFQRFLEGLQRTLQAVEAEVTGQHQPTVFYRIVGLETGSARLQLQAEDRGAGNGEWVLRRFTRTVAAVGRGEELEGTSYETLTALHGLAGALKRHVRRLQFGLDGLSVPVPADFEIQLDRLLGQVACSYGSYRGKLEHINLHGGRPRFFIYPPAGPVRIQCTYKREEIPNIGDYLEKVVEVRGIVKYRGDDPYPVLIEVEEIRAFPPARDLPTVDDLLGSIPNLTGELDTVSYLEMLRRDPA